MTTDTPMTDAAIERRPSRLRSEREMADYADIANTARRLERDRAVLIAALEQARGLYAAEEELAEYFRKGLVAAELALSVIASNPVRPMGISTVHAIEARDLARATLAQVRS